MSDEKQRQRGPSEYAQNEGARPTRRRTSFIAKFLFLLLVLLAAWIGWYAYRQGKVPDLTSEEQQKKMLQQAKEDLVVAEEKATEASKQFVSWAKLNIEDLKKRIKGNPPESKEEVSDLVNESKREVSVKDREASLGGTDKGGAGAKTAQTGAAGTKAESLMKLARESYRTGLGAYAQTDPSSPQQQIQSKLREAEPYFIKCLDLLEQARREGAGGAELDSLEQAAAKRLYDCRKRMELSRV